MLLRKFYTLFFLIFTALFISQCAVQHVQRDRQTWERKQNPGYEQEPVTEESDLPDGKLFSKKADFFENVKKEIQKFWGAPYVWGGETPQGVDCSGFVMAVYQNAAGISLPHSTSQLFKLGMSIQQKNLKFGDLVFFNNNNDREPDHVGIYIANDRFVHASTSQGVTLSKLSAGPYQEQLTGIRRILKDN